MRTLLALALVFAALSFAPARAEAEELGERALVEAAPKVACLELKVLLNSLRFLLLVH